MVGYRKTALLLVLWVSYRCLSPDPRLIAVAFEHQTSVQTTKGDTGRTGHPPHVVFRKKDYKTSEQIRAQNRVSFDTTAAQVTVGFEYASFSLQSPAARVRTRGLSRAPPTSRDI